MQCFPTYVVIGDKQHTAMLHRFIVRVSSRGVGGRLGGGGEGGGRKALSWYRNSLIFTICSSRSLDYIVSFITGGLEFIWVSVEEK